MKAQTEAPRRLREFEQICRRQGLPLTIQRRVVLEALLEHRDHPTVDQVYDDVRKRIPGVSRTTVYRVLERLVGLGVARHANHPGAAARFDPNTAQHHHLVCTSCHAVVDFDDPVLGRLHVPDVRRTGFRITDYSVHFSGLCANCRKREPPRKEKER